MKAWIVLLALARGIITVSADSPVDDKAWDRLPGIRPSKWDLAGAGPDHIETWVCQGRAFKDQKWTGKSTKDKKFSGVLDHVANLNEPLINQPDGIWSQISCDHDIGVSWRNTGNESKSVFGVHVAYYADVLANQFTDGPGHEPSPDQAGFIAPACKTGGDKYGGSLGIIKLKDGWEVNVGSCK